MAKYINKNKRNTWLFYSFTLGCLLCSMAMAAEKASPGHKVPKLYYDRPADTVHPDLTALSKTFAPKIQKITDTVYGAIGFGLANVYMVVGDDGIVVIDVGVDTDFGDLILSEFRKITTKPVKAVVYTHNHVDHISGVTSFVSREDVESGKVKVIAHATFMEELQKEPGLYSGIIQQRTKFHSGVSLPIGPEGFVNFGCCPGIGPGSRALIAPTLTFDDELDLEIAGVKLKFVHVPSETRDEIAVWLPEQKVIFTADVLMGESFPNMHTSRGSKYRDIREWFHSLDRMRAFNADYMAPGHGRPVFGGDNVNRTLTNYRDAIKFVADQGARYFNRGYRAEDVAEVLELPPHLASDPWLNELYGTVKLSLHGLYSGNIGWFDGTVWKLDPMPLRDRMEKYVSLMGGRDNLFQVAKDAFDNGEYTWAAELLDYLIRLNPEDMEVRRLQADAYEQWAFKQKNAPYRHWGLLSAKELRGELPTKVQEVGLLSSEMDIDLGESGADLLDYMGVRLKAEECLDVIATVGVVIKDTGEQLGLQIRRGVSEALNEIPADSPVIELNHKHLKQMAVHGALFGNLLSAGDVRILKGNRDDIQSFFDYFEPISRDIPPLALPAYIGH